MSAEFDWKKFSEGLLGATSGKPKKKDFGLTPYQDALIEKESVADEKRWEMRRREREREYEIATRALESNLMRLEAIEREIRNLQGQGQPDTARVLQTVYEKFGLLAMILRSKVNIPESKAAEYYSSLKAIQRFLRERKLGDAEAEKQFDAEIEMAYADYWRNQMRLRENVFDEKERGQHGFLMSKEAADLADRIISCGEKSLEHSRRSADDGAITIELDSRHEIYNEGIIISKSRDESATNVRVPAKDYYIIGILGELIRYGVFRKRMDLARQWEAEMAAIKIGFRLKGGGHLVEQETDLWAKRTTDG